MLGRVNSVFGSNYTASLMVLVSNVFWVMDFVVGSGAVLQLYDKSS